MNKENIKVFNIISNISFILLNLIHIFFPINLIIEDIKNGTMHGTSLELGALFPWLIEFIAIPFIIIELIILIILRKNLNKLKLNLIIFILFILQIIIFNILLFL